MGIPYKDCEYVNGTFHCFPDNKAPRYLFIRLYGVEAGDNYNPSDGPMPNGVFRAEYEGNNKWSGSNANDSYWIFFTSTAAEIYFDRGGGLVSFYSAVYAVCPLKFPSYYTSPVGRHFYGGHAIYTHTCPAVSVSLHRPAPLIGADGGDETFCENTDSDDPTGTWYRYADKKLRIRLKIKFDAS